MSDALENLVNVKQNAMKPLRHLTVNFAQTINSEISKPKEENKPIKKSYYSIRINNGLVLADTETKETKTNSVVQAIRKEIEVCPLSCFLFCI